MLPCRQSVVSMLIAFMGSELVYSAVEHVLARENVRVHNLQSLAQLVKIGAENVSLLIIARPLRRSLLSRVRHQFPRARSVAIAQRARRAPIEVLAFADIWPLRQRIRDLIRTDTSARPPTPA